MSRRITILPGCPEQGTVLKHTARKIIIKMPNCDLWVAFYFHKGQHVYTRVSSTLDECVKMVGACLGSFDTFGFQYEN